MLNTGLSLRKPYESLYGAYHRFLVSNSGLNPKTIVQALQCYEDKKTKFDGNHYALLAQHHEIDFCQINHIPYYSPDPIPTSLKIRGCVECSAMGYHSIAFEWEWLTHCPLHKTPLTYQCPTCQKNWPTFKEILHRHCSTCGWPVSRHQILSSEAYTTSWDAFKELKDIQLTYHSLTKMQLTTPHPWYYNSQHEHQTVSVEHKLFASIYTKLFPACRQQLAKTNVPLKKIIHLIYPLDLTEKKTLLNKEDLHQHEIQTRSRVESRILQSIAEHKHRQLDIPPRFDMEHHDIDENTDCYMYAYLYWKKLVNAPLGKGPRYSQSRYFNFGLGIHPLIPLPMYEMGLQENSIGNRYFNRNNTNLTVPLNMALLIYEIDLWCCFKAVLKYFDTLKTTRDFSDGLQFYQLLPEWALPGKSYADAISVYLRSAGIIDVFIPALFINPALDDLSLNA